jgi:thiol-disulfide isomerase/thioredoxin
MRRLRADPCAHSPTKPGRQLHADQGEAIFMSRFQGRCKFAAPAATHLLPLAFAGLSPGSPLKGIAMKSLVKLIASLAFALFAMAASSASMPFEQAAFDKAVAAGGPVIVQFHADWCPTCRAQAPLVKQELAEPKMKDVKFFVANFDTEKDLKKALKVSTQSTFVVFKGGKEVARSTGQTTLGAIDATFSKAL